jgi:hypothetical protein
MPGFAAPGDRPGVTETAAGPDVTEAATDPDITRMAGGRPARGPAGPAGPAGPDYGPDLSTRQSVDFAAAPVATGYPGPAPAAEDAATGYPGDDPNSIWDLAATDVFPVAPAQPPDDEAPGASVS